MITRIINTGPGLPRKQPLPDKPGANIAGSFSICSPVLAIFVLVSACTPSASTLPSITPEVVERQVETVDPEQEVITHGIEPEQEIIVADDPWALAEQAEGAPADQAASYLLPAIAGFIELQQLATAQSLIEQLQTRPMTGFQQDSLKFHQAQLAQALGQHSAAIAGIGELLRSHRQSPGQAPDFRARLLLLLASSQQALHRKNEAVTTLLQRDVLLDQSGRITNQQNILTLIGSLDPLSLSLLRESPSNNAINGWIALSEILQSGLPEDRLLEIQRWRSLYPEHPAEQALLDQYQLAVRSIHYKHIAMLLPLTSPFGKAAQAYYDGFMASHSEDHSTYQPAVSLHDIGDDPALASLYYQAAINNGADFVVGPLGRLAVNALLSGPRSELPTLVIGNVPPDKTAPDLYGISLSPEQEARQVAERAFSDGLRQASIFRSNSEWGQRVATAFAVQWESLGGTVVDNAAFPPDIPDYSQIIKKLLGLDKSITRERILSAQLDVDLKFTPRRRDDIDFLFLAANASQARLLVPQLRFFQAHDLALYATSYVYSGKPNPATDADLDGIIFGDMDWILDVAVLPQPEPEPEQNQQPATEDATTEDSAQPDLSANSDTTSVAAPGANSVASPETTVLTEQPNLRESSPYYHTDLDRLYALGLASYKLIPRLDALRNNQWQRYPGKTMDISVGLDGNVLRHLTWARFDQGIPVPLPRGTGIIPVPNPGQ